MELLYPFFFGEAVPAYANSLVFTGLFAIIFAGYMAWMIGSNDIANAMATSVGSKALTYKQAVIIAAIADFLGAVIAGGTVTDTVRKGIVNSDIFANDPNLLILGMVAAMLSAGIWLHVATSLGLPVSTTHSIVGAIVGFGLLLYGVNAVNWAKVGSIVASWILSPIGGGIVAALLYMFIRKVILNAANPMKRMYIWGPILGAITIGLLVLAGIWKGFSKMEIMKGIDWTPLNLIAVSSVAALIGFVVLWFLVRRYVPENHPDLSGIERIFIILQVMTATYVAFSHGANDVANAIGPLAAVLDTLRTGVVTSDVSVPLWILIYGGGGIALGLSLHGYKVMRTVGEKITEITPSRGFAAELSAASVVTVFSKMGMPVSTTHTLVGAVLGIGLVSGAGALNYSVIRNIAFSWILTLPVAGILCVTIFWILRMVLSM
ncbi:MAG TPA: inorganic phosphate transporter [Bacteroidetes bacterium]|nr:low-affinity inorganic phosphate transporter 1 [bacterium BMS3Bbin04]HDO66373.1 inorganic phosphate transporter [Bacteroidota bacterium]HEX05498.1 inorganic phosphate transporter [Bacteroidota bacterium]